MGFFGNLFKSEFEKWVEGASHEELSDAYEEERQKWIREGYNGGTGEKTSKMNRLRNCREIICIFLESMLIYVMNEFSDSGGHFHGT